MKRRRALGPDLRRLFTYKEPYWSHLHRIRDRPDQDGDMAFFKPVMMEKTSPVKRAALWACPSGTF
jgi:hypothetical protein